VKDGPKPSLFFVVAISWFINIIIIIIYIWYHHSVIASSMTCISRISEVAFLFLKLRVLIYLVILVSS
jgi:hypothetical protein